MNANGGWSVETVYFLSSDGFGLNFSTVGYEETFPWQYRRLTIPIYSKRGSGVGAGVTITLLVVISRIFEVSSGPCPPLYPPLGAKPDLVSD